MATNVQIWEPRECSCKIVFAFDTNKVQPSDPWEDHYADFAVIPGIKSPDGTFTQSILCPAHQGVTPADILKTVHNEHKKVSSVVRSLWKNNAQAAGQKNIPPVVAVWSGQDKNRTPTMRVNPLLKGTITVGQLRAAKTDAELEHGPGTISIDESSV